MTQSNKKILIITSVLAVSLILLLLFVFIGIDLGPFKIASISEFINEYNSVKNTEAKLTSTQDTYYNTLKNLEKAKTEYDVQKNKYNAISDETVEVIKEATTSETYNIEYMWIKLGNYAKKNNLEIVMVEPGGILTTNGNTNNKTSSGNSTNSTTNNSNNNTSSTTTSNSNMSSYDTSALRIEVKGSYMNTSDFIFEVENDNDLKFKLDNISMDYIEGTTIKTSFNIKNITIKK